MSFSTAVDQAFLDHFLATYTTLWAGYSTTTPTKAGANVTEPAGGYARIQVNANLTRTGSEVDNDAAIEFPEASGDQGTVTHAVLYTTETGGTMLWFGELAASKSITAGSTPTFTAGDFNITQV